MMMTKRTGARVGSFALTAALGVCLMAAVPASEASVVPGTTYTLDFNNLTIGGPSLSSLYPGQGGISISYTPQTQGWAGALGGYAAPTSGGVVLSAGGFQGSITFTAPTSQTVTLDGFDLGSSGGVAGDTINVTIYVDEGSSPSYNHTVDIDSLSGLTGGGHLSLTNISGQKVQLLFQDAVGDNALDNIQYTVSGGSGVSGVPEPSTISVALLGVGGLVLLRRRRRTA